MDTVFTHTGRVTIEEGVTVSCSADFCDLTLAVDDITIRGEVRAEEHSMQPSSEPQVDLTRSRSELVASSAGFVSHCPDRGL